ncbi:hypothetical protein KSP40_PGU010707 [Platanthera guangdongensis]|uniref:Retroviral polymerase SH3-like domain-containing protein n=1 Tax=Platanthera guangdongensis TaxID=2320717 RepID=A0ABR2MUT8_9ASPA
MRGGLIGFYEEAQIYVCDINPNMLNVGKKRAIEQGLGEERSLVWVEGDAEALKFEDGSMDGYTIAFGIRNVTHIEKVLAEAYRGLPPYYLTTSISLLGLGASQVYCCCKWDAIPVSGSADIHITPSITLRSVLYVPSSTFNLLSISRLTQDLDCYVTFSSTSCVVQDRKTQSIIGKRHLSNGLYILDPSPPTVLSYVSSSEWHCHLEHPPLNILSKVLPDVSIREFTFPFNLLFTSTPPFSVTPRVFGCVCYVHNLDPSTNKLAPRATKYMFVGYSCIQKGYVCFSPKDHKVVTSADVTFLEDQPYHSQPTGSLLPPLLPRPDVPITSNLLPLLPTPLPPNPPPLTTPLPHKPPITRVYTRRPPSSTTILEMPSSDDILQPADPTITSTAHPMTNYVSFNCLSPELRQFALSLSSITIPTSVQEAFQHPG